MDAWQLTGLLLGIAGVFLLAGCAIGYWYAEKERDRRG